MTVEKTFKQALYLIFVLALAAPAGAQDEVTDLSGDWTFDILTSPNGPGRRDVVIRQEGNRVFGFADSEMASGGFVGTFDGKNLQFTVVLKFGSLPVAGDYVAVVHDDTMEGTIDYGDYGTATFEGHRGRAAEVEEFDPAKVVGLASKSGLEVARVGDNFGIDSSGTLAPEMVAIEGGTFTMGSHAEGSFADQQFIHKVEVSPFRMGRFPVTNAQYLTFCEATGRTPPDSPRGWGNYLHHNPNHPVVNVTWEKANAYTQWLTKITGENYRLPTEAEWEYAALAGDEGRLYSWGDVWQTEGGNTLSWHAGEKLGDDWMGWWETVGEKKSESEPMTTRVGSFMPNAWGLYDITGNVWEWTRDFYQEDYYKISPAKDPMGPTTGKEKVLRGGSWYNLPGTVRIAVRDRYAPELRVNYIGFRIVAVGSEN